MVGHQLTRLPHEPLIAAALSAPVTHAVRTIYSDGAMRVHHTRSHATAAMYATGERRKIGKALVDRETGAARIVLSVEIVPA